MGEIRKFLYEDSSLWYSEIEHIRNYTFIKTIAMEPRKINNRE